MQRGLLVCLGKIRLFFGPCPSRNLGETHLKTQFRFRLFHSGTLGKSVTSLNLWNRYSILVLIPCIVVKTRSVRSILCPSAPSCLDGLCQISRPHSLLWVSGLSLYTVHIPTACSSPYT